MIKVSNFDQIVTGVIGRLQLGLCRARGATWLPLRKVTPLGGTFSAHLATDNPNPVSDGYRGLDSPSGIRAGRAS